MRRSLLTLLAILVTVAVTLLWANLPSIPLPPNSHADRIVVRKSEHTLTLYTKGEVLRVYKVALGRGAGSAKRREGDHETPEGMYVIDSRKPQSRFHKALHVSYPSAEDKAAAARLGAPPGGDVMIHGIEHGLGWLGRLHRSADWTDGCVAVTDSEIDQIWNAVPAGTHIEIRH